jgi:nicotinamide mononucleotide transporter
MSLWGWYLWTRVDPNKHTIILQITNSNMRDWFHQVLFFLAFYFSLYFSLTYLKKEFAPEAIPWADALASAAAYTGMWLMAKKKVESWIWWIITNIASIPLYFIKGYTFTSVQFIVLLVLAIAGLKSWNDKAKNNVINATL